MDVFLQMLIQISKHSEITKLPSEWQNNHIREVLKELRCYDVNVNNNHHCWILIPSCLSVSANSLAPQGLVVTLLRFG